MKQKYSTLQIKLTTTPTIITAAMKNITLIRHGESLGQSARSRGINRQTDASLHDCFLTPKGIKQAIELHANMRALQRQKDGYSNEVELVCVSPLTRAIATCVIGLGHLSSSHAEQDENVATKAATDHATTTTSSKNNIVPFICHPNLAEYGRIPENQGRQIKTVCKSIQNELHYLPPSYSNAVEQIDFTLLPSTWPNTRSQQNQKQKGSSVQDFLVWLHERSEINIIVICHHNVIMSLLRRQIRRVENCVPIQCVMLDGDITSLYIKSDGNCNSSIMIPNSNPNPEIVKGKGKKSKLKRKKMI